MITKQEITDIVYDALMENRGGPYVMLDLADVENQECDAKAGFITFEYGQALIKIDVSVRINGVWL